MPINLRTYETANRDIPDLSTVVEDMVLNEARLYIYTGTNRMLGVILGENLTICDFDQSERWEDILWWINNNLKK